MERRTTIQVLSPPDSPDEDGEEGLAFTAHWRGQLQYRDHRREAIAFCWNHPQNTYSGLVLFPSPPPLSPFELNFYF